MPLDRITRAGVTRWFDRYSMSAPGAANGALNLPSRIINHAILYGHLQTNPARGVKRNIRPKLTCFLSRDEVRRLHRALDRHVCARPLRARQAAAIRLLPLTRCRKGEIRTLRWSGPRRVFLNAPARTIPERQPRSGSAYCVDELLPWNSAPGENRETDA